MTKWIFGLLLCLTGMLFGGSVRLINDSPFALRAVIRGADGSYLGERTLDSQESQTWSDGAGSLNAPSTSQTPYSVAWYCKEGGNFSFCPVVSSGGSVSAQSCDGPRSCTSPKQAQPSELVSPPRQSDFGPPSQGVGPPRQ